MFYTRKYIGNHKYYTAIFTTAFVLYNEMAQSLLSSAADDGRFKAVTIGWSVNHVGGLNACSEWPNESLPESSGCCEL